MGDENMKIYFFFKNLTKKVDFDPNIKKRIFSKMFWKTETGPNLSLGLFEDFLFLKNYGI